MVEVTFFDFFEVTSERDHKTTNCAPVTKILKPLYLNTMPNVRRSEVSFDSDENLQQHTFLDESRPTCTKNRGHNWYLTKQ